MPVLNNNGSQSKVIPEKELEFKSNEVCSMD